MKIKITKATVADKKARVVGDIVPVEKTEGVFLISIGKAIEYIKPADDIKPAEKEEDKPSKEKKTERKQKTKKSF